jgi:hypothetical protein
MKNAFDEWRVFHGFDISKSIVNLSKHESLMKNLVNMLSSFVLQVEKRQQFVSSNEVNKFSTFLYFFVCCQKKIAFKKIPNPEPYFLPIHFSSFFIFYFLFFGKC